MAAGRSSFLDDGLDSILPRCVATGTVLAERRVAHPQDVSVDMGRNQSDDTGVVSDLLVSEGDSVYMRHIRLFGTEGPEVGWGQRVSATAGMLDDSWFNRTLWLVDGRDHGELLVHDDGGVYSIRVHKSRGHGQYIEPGMNAYQIVATDRTPLVPRRPGAVSSGTKAWPKPKKARWNLPTPYRVTAMAVGGETLLCAGAPDVLDLEEPWAAYEGRRGGMLFACRVY